MPANLKHVKSAESATVHSMPCKIHADDHADVKSFFTPKITASNDEGSYTASFRGFPLDGKDVPLPDGYSGLVVNVDDTQGLVKNHKCSARFDKFTYWNWNKIPSKNDPLLAALDWIDISAATVAPIAGDRRAPGAEEEKKLKKFQKIIKKPGSGYWPRVGLMIDTRAFNKLTFRHKTHDATDLSTVSYEFINPTFRWNGGLHAELVTGAYAVPEPEDDWRVYC